MFSCELVTGQPTSLLSQAHMGMSYMHSHTVLITHTHPHIQENAFSAIVMGKHWNGNTFCKGQREEILESLRTARDRASGDLICSACILTMPGH